MFARNAEFYQSLFDRMGVAIGVEAYTADDGTIMEDVLAIKVCEIVEAKYGKS
jgi:hypothetical protein